MVTLITGCGPSTKTDDPKEEAPPFDDISHFFGSWQSATEGADVSFAINNKFLGKEVIKASGGNQDLGEVTRYFYSGSIKCEAIGVEVTISEKPDFESLDDYIAITEIAKYPGIYGLAVFASSSETEFLYFSCFYKESSIWSYYSTIKEEGKKTDFTEENPLKFIRVE